MLLLLMLLLLLLMVLLLLLMLLLCISLPATMSPVCDSLACPVILLLRALFSVVFRNIC